MDQINALKGYGKVTNLELESQIPQPSKPNNKTPNHKSLRLTAAIAATSAAILLTIILAAHIHNSTAKKSPNSADTIQIVCNVTRNPSSCVASIISLNPAPKPDPKQILNLSLQVSLNELTNLSRSLKTLAAADNGAALKDCESQIEDAIGLVSDSVDGGAGETALTEREIGDIQTWMSSAMTDQETCLDGLQEMDSASFREVKTMMAKSVEYVSNSLAIIANFHVILAKFNTPLH